uniref:Cytochrome b n=1 Tax=Lanthanaphalara mira TaxID=2218050 RepID=A0A344A2G8_9HEMI|nr:cytochrome b [Lanthanaphalara mira]AWU48959.1 cytochrome b [Lanthanaphalara mira]
MLMFMNILKKNVITKSMFNTLINLPTPSNINFMWNFGSMLGLMLMIQIISGIFLAMHYAPNTILAFDSVIHICRDVNNGWMLRVLHSNGASFFFMFVYIHIGRGIYFNSQFLFKTWMSGIMILFLLMGTAFMGYVLPWGQMSFWGATVITNLLSAIPYLGENLVMWLWGGFAVDNPTLNRFFTIHFLLPFILALMIIFHLIFLHETGSSNPLGTPMNNDKIPFFPYFLIKDFLGFMMFFFVLMTTIMYFPYLMNDPDNFIPANPMNTPLHIQPEWYFLFAYSILRAIPNKLGGVIALVSSILILITLPFFKKSFFKGIQFYPISKHIYWSWINIFILLTWIGMKPVEAPYISMSQVFTAMYFMIFLLIPLTQILWDKMNNL